MIKDENQATCKEAFQFESPLPYIPESMKVTPTSPNDVTFSATTSVSSLLNKDQVKNIHFPAFFTDQDFMENQTRTVVTSDILRETSSNGVDNNPNMITFPGKDQKRVIRNDDETLGPVEVMQRNASCFDRCILAARSGRTVEVRTEIPTNDAVAQLCLNFELFPGPINDKHAARKVAKKLKVPIDQLQKVWNLIADIYDQERDRYDYIVVNNQRRTFQYAIDLSILPPPIPIV